MKLAGKRVLITGASRGIGAAIARAFAREGARLVVTSRAAGAVRLAEELRQAGAEADGTASDVADEAQVRALVQLCRTKLGGLDVLVNNAGILAAARLGMMKMDEVQRMFATNVFGAMNLTQYAIRLFPAGTGGAIINLASIAGTQGIEGLSAYSASKAAVVGFTRAAAKELAAQRIRVNAIAPGFIDTDMARQVSPEWFQRRVEGIRTGRIGRPEEVAAVAAFLASDDAKYVTGQVVGVDGSMIT